MRKGAINCTNLATVSKKTKFDTSFDFGANTSSKPRKSSGGKKSGSRFGQRKTPSGRIYFAGGKGGGGS
jgi:hypothetical protein